MRLCGMRTDTWEGATDSEGRGLERRRNPGMGSLSCLLGGGAMSGEPTSSIPARVRSSPSEPN